MNGGVVTFLFTDVQGFASLWERRPDLMGAVIARHLDLVSGLVRSAGGEVFKTVGDAVCAAFAEPQPALRAALQIQLALLEPDPDLGEVLRTRVAVHSGSADRRDGDYFGRAVNRVSRVLSGGHGGQTLVTQATRELVRDELPEGATLIDLGLHRLRDLGEERIYQLAEARLAQIFPPLRTLDARLTNLPVQLSAFWGRERELAVVVESLHTSRLVTLTGPGGVGKTRLSLQCAGSLGEIAPSGVWLVELAGLTRGEDVPAAIAGVLAERMQGARGDLDSVVSAIGDRAMVLLLDNAEHLTGAVATAARKLLENGPGLRLLVTSRAPLHLPGERVVPILPLALPPEDSEEQVRASHAARLFVERAHAVSPEFELDAHSAGAVAAICRAVGGLPLGLELAAARVAELGVMELARRLPGHIVELDALDPTAPARQSSVGASIEWSFRLLGPSEQAVFRRISWLSGSFTLPCAEAVAGDAALGANLKTPLPGVADPGPAEPPVAASRVANLIATLVRGSMVVRESGPRGDRFRLLHPLREFGRAALTAAGAEAGVTARRAVIYALTEAERQEPLLVGPDQAAAQQSIEADLDNLRAAMDHAERDPLLPTVALRLAVAMGPFFYQRGLITEGKSWVTRGLQRTPEGADRLHARALGWAGNMVRAEGDIEVALRHYQAAADLWTELGDRKALAAALSNLGNIEADARRLDRAAELHRRAVQIYRHELNDEYGAACASMNESVCLARQERWSEFVRVLEPLLQVFEQRDPYRHAVALRNLAEGYWALGRFADADAAVRASFRFRLEMNDRRSLGPMVVLGAAIQMGLGRGALAAKWLGLGERLLREHPTAAVSRPTLAEARALIAGAMSPEEMSTHVRQGDGCTDLAGMLSGVD